MRVEIITHKSGDQLPILLDKDGLPIPTPNEFILSRRALGTNTLVRNLREITVFYRWLESVKIDLWQRIYSGQVFNEAEVKGGMIEALRREQISDRKVKRLAISPHTFNQRILTIRQFLAWCFDTHLSTIPLSDQSYERIRDQQLRVLKWLDVSFISAPPMNKAQRKGLSKPEAQFLINCLDPHNSIAPGRNLEVKFRNYIVTMMMLHYGLRPGEVLSLRVEDIEIGAISAIRIQRRSPDSKDNRRPRPQIKRNGRVIPIENHQFSKYLDEYILKWRDALAEKATEESDYLILSDDGNPLSQSIITQFFQSLRKRFSSDLPQHLTAKALRHTFSSMMEKSLRDAGIEEERRKQALAILRGDSSSESQSVYISQEIEEQAHNALKNLQRKLLSDEIC